ncbi:TonB-dependent siderophore receptor [Pseudomonas aeruginosa]|nr:TonB-dependent siderophore receptor [Pseudomonas aeruginosa]
MPRPTFRPGLLALAIALAVPAPFLHAAPAEQASVRDYRIAAGPLAGTLNRIAAPAGLVLTLDPALAEGRSAHAVQGRFDAPGALREALKGSGLELVENAGGTYSLRKVPEDTLSLQAMTVSGAEEDPLGPTSGYVAKRSMTGTKTDTPILETPRSISVATRQQMTDRAVHNLDDAVRYMPGVVASSFGSDSRSDWLKVRGFKPTQFLDGLPMATGSYNNPKLETWNLERLALLRGPASSVYGQTPPGGMLDMVSLRPQGIASHELKAEIGNYNHKQVSFDSTGPIDDEGRFLYHLSGVVRDSNTQVDHIDDKRYNIAPSLTWNIDDDTRLTFLSQFNRDDTAATSQFLPLRGTKYDAPFGKISHHKNLGDPDWDFYDRTYYWLGYSFERRINDVWQFRQNLRYLRNDLSFQTLTPTSSIDAASADGTLQRMTTSVDEDISQFVVDNNFQADFETGALRHTLLLGIDHNRTRTDYTSIYNFTGVPPTNVNNPIYGQPIPKPSRSSAFYDYRQKTYQTGLYVQDQIALDNWRLTLGGREDWVHAGATFYNQNDATNTSRDKKFSGNAALSYIFDNGLAPYLSYAESFQPSTGADDIGSNKMFKPTEGKQWELGVKYQPVGSDSLFTAAVYDLRQENVRVTDNVNGTPTTSQAGEVKVTGLELEATSNVTDNLKVIGSYSYADTEVKKGQYAGNRLQQAPRNQASLWADYTWHEGTLNGFSVGAGARYVGSTYGDQANTYDGYAGSYTLYDAAVRYDLGQLNGSLKGVSVAVNANNLFNKDYLASCDGYYCYYGDQRSVVGSVSYKW